MSSTLGFLIIDGYAKASREELDRAGMKQAWLLYAEMLKKYLPGAEYAVWFPSDDPIPPDGLGPEHYAGILWTGCNLTIYDSGDARVTRQIEFAKKSYEAGTCGFGTCWGVQMAAVAAGGEVRANPRGREMGLARKIRLTPAGLGHPMFEGKPAVYGGFISHLDEIMQLPPGAALLASNDFTSVQAIEVKHRKGVFWATQYHPEYDLHEMARLITAREPKLVPEGFFRDHQDLAQYVEKLETLHRTPDRKDLRWQLDIDDDVLSDQVRQVEFRNWINKIVLPRAAGG
ncbi:MAG: type 1 glutamine amidotransferase [Bryobacterales bacterium]|nr:type 1 glutamine amidotransferase [Bryobacterales bacterium]